MLYLATFLLFFLPLVIFPIGSLVFEPPKVLIAEICIEILLVLVLFRERISLKNYSPVFLLSLGSILLLSCIHLIFYNTSTTFFGNPFRTQGIFLLWHLLIFSFLSSFIFLSKIPKKLIVASFLGLLITIPLLGTNPAGRYIGSLGEPNALAATLLFFWPITFFVLPHQKPKVGVFLSTLLFIFLTGSRSGFIGLFIQSLFMLTSKKLSYVLATSLCITFLTFSLVLPFIEGGGRYEDRSDIWKTALYTGLEKPLFGHGFGNIEQAIPQTSQRLGSKAQYQYVDSTHNIFLDWWVQAGVIGIICIGVLVGNSFRVFIVQKKPIELSLLLGVLAVLFFNPGSIVTLLAFWYLIGQSSLRSKI